MTITLQSKNDFFRFSLREHLGSSWPKLGDVPNNQVIPVAQGMNWSVLPEPVTTAS